MGHDILLAFIFGNIVALLFMKIFNLIFNLSIQF